MAARRVIDPIWRMLTGAFCFASGVFMAISLASYLPSDPSWNTASQSVVQNLFGMSGAVFADFALQTLGWSAWMAAIGAMIAGARRTLLLHQPSSLHWAIGILSIPLSAVAMASWPVPEIWPLQTGLGGLLGDGVVFILTLPVQNLGLSSLNLWLGILFTGLALWAGLFAFGFNDRQFNRLINLGRFLSRQIWRALSWLMAQVSRRQSQTPRPNPQQDPYLEKETGLKSKLNAVKALFVRKSSPVDEEALRAPEDHSEIQLTETVPPRVPAPSVQTEKISAPPKIRRLKGGRTGPFILPTLALLEAPPEQVRNIDEEALLQKAERLTEVLREFGVRGHIIEVRPGPIITLFELEPAAGVKSARVISLADDIARSMSAISARVAVIPGKNAIGIELPNEHRETVYFHSLLSSEAYQKSKAVLPMALGEDIGGKPTVVELAKMPHLLIAGTTGSGKSVGVNAMILSLLFRLTPQQCRFIMIDPKMLELSIYEGIPHLLSPVVTDPKKAVNALKWAVREMEGRYELMSKANVRNLAGFNAKAGDYRKRSEKLIRKIQTGYDEAGKPIFETEVLPTESIPNIVIVIDEMADLMMVAGKEIEGCIQRLAQMARAAGIHLITATQRPSVDVITGTIKANFPTRISYMVTTKIDSRTILGEQGAEQLLGMGDLLYQAPGVKTKRLHGPFVSDADVETVVEWLKEYGEPDYQEDILEEPGEGETSPVMDAIMGTGSGNEEEDLYKEAMAIVLRDKRASTSYLQRRLKIGYNRAATLVEQLEENGVISGPNHAGKREILMKSEDAS